MAKYFLTNKAVDDLSNIWGYTYEAWSEYQADKYYELLIDFCRKISENPKLGKFYPEIDGNLLGYKASHHIIFYIVQKPAEIEIVRILHERMDLKNRLQE